MNNLNPETLSALVIVVALLGLAGYFAWRQWRTLRQLPGREDISAEEKQFQRSQAWRRLFTSVVMVVMAGLLIGTYGMGQEERAEKLAQPGQVHPDPERHRQELQDFLTQYGWFWVIFGLLLLSLVVLAFVDVIALRRFARAQFRRIQTERRAMIERELSQLRRERNGF